MFQWILISSLLALLDELVVVDENLYLALEYHIELVAVVALIEYELAG